MLQVDRMLRDDALQETRKHGTSAFPFEIYLDDLGKFDRQTIEWHWHNEIEILMVERGPIDVSVERERRELRSGEGAIINSGVIHRFEGHDGALMPNFLFRPTWLAPEGSLIYEKYVRSWTEAGPSVLWLSPAVPRQKEILEQISLLYESDIAGTSDFELEALERTLRIWRILWEHAAPSGEKKAATRGMDLTQARLKTMIQFMQDHFAEHLTLADIAGAAAVSTSEALRCFHVGVQSTPVAYLNHIRLGHARRLLTESGSSVHFIAGECGFTGAAYLDRLFRREYGCTPGEYRKSRGE